jgi:hypothetical protein
VDVTLLYFEGCPNWKTTQTRLEQAMRALGVAPEALRLRRVETPAGAEELAFHGSPTVLVDGSDPFAEPGGAVGLACRVYPTEGGLAGSPTQRQLTEVLRELL